MLALICIGLLSRGRHFSPNDPTRMRELAPTKVVRRRITRDQLRVCDLITLIYTLLTLQVEHFVGSDKPTQTGGLVLTWFLLDIGSPDRLFSGAK